MSLPLVSLRRPVAAASDSVPWLAVAAVAVAVVVVGVGVVVVAVAVAVACYPWQTVPVVTAAAP